MIEQFLTTFNTIRFIFISLCELAQISTSVQQTMADVAHKPRALTQQAAVPVTVYLDLTAMELPA